MRKRFNILPTYHFEENTDGQIRGAAEHVLRDCTIYGNCGKNLVNLDAGIDAKGVLIKNNDGTYKLTKQSTSRFAKIIPVRIPANTRFVISYELIEYTGAESYRPIQLILKFSGRENTTVSPYNDKSTNKKIYSTSWMFVNDVIAIQLYCEGKDAQPVGSYTVFKNFQIELGDESYSEGIDYEPYKEVGDSDAESGKYILPVTVSGKNLIPYPYDKTTEVRNGVTFTDNGDGTITVNGTATSNTYFIFNDKLKNIIDISKKYILSGSSDIPVYIALYQDNIWKKSINSINGKPVILDFPNYTNIEYNRILVATYVLSGKTVNNAIVKPMLELGEVATSFEPYGYKIPLVNGEEETVLYLPAPLGAGETVNSTEASLPPLPLHEGTNQITAATATPPAKIRVDYRARVKAEAYHAD